MGKSKKKTIILISSIGVGILIVILLLLLFLATDLFKSSQQLFYKYLPQNAQLVEIFSSNLSASYEEKMKQNPYTSEGEISFSYEMGDQETQEETTSNMELLKIRTEGKVDQINQKQYHKVALTKNDQEILAVKYLQTGDLYALTSESIVTKYVAVENNNLKELAQKLGYSDTDQIPDKIESTIDIEDILQFTEEEKESIMNTYGTLLVKNISKDHFTKANKIALTIDGQNYQANQYTLKLTSLEIKDLMVKVLQQLQNDEEILNIILNKYNAIATNDTMTTNLLKQQIQQLEDSINEKSIDNETIQVSLYVANNKLIKTELEMGEKKLSLQYTNGARENKVVITDESTQNSIFRKAEFIKSETEDQYVLSATITNLGNTQNTINIQISRVGNINSSTIKKLDMVTVNIDNNVYTLKYSNNINFENNLQIEELNQENSITLNSYSETEVQQLLTAIIERTQQVWSEKLAQIGVDGDTSSLENIATTQENEETEQETQQTELSSTEKLAIEMYNEQFLSYLGDKISADQVKNLLTVAKTAIQNQNSITVRYTGTYNNTSVEKEVTTSEELEALEVYIVNGKNYKIQGLADTTGKLAELTITENVTNT